MKSAPTEAVRLSREEAILLATQPRRGQRPPVARPESEPVWNPQVETEVGTGQRGI